MAEKKLRILLRNDLVANWELHNPKLSKGEVGVCFLESGVRFKVGDGVKSWNDLPFVNDYDSVIDELKSRLNTDEADIDQLKLDIAALQADLAKKVDKTIEGANGTARIFNEADGGGAKFEHKDGSEAFVGVNDGGKDGLMAQIYADKLNAEGKWEGAKLDITNNGMFYTVGDKSFADRTLPENELATKGDVAAAVADKQDKLPEGDNDFYLHKNADTGAIEWAAVEQVTPTFAGLEGDPRDNEKLSAELDKVLADAEAYTEEQIGKIVQIKYAVVDDLPEAGADVEFTKSGTIYLKKESGTGNDIYNEFICINEGTVESPIYEWEQIGSTRIDLSDYRKAADQDVIDNAIKAQITAEVERATGVEDGLNTRLTTAESDIDALQADSHTHANKEELDKVSAGDVAKWNAKQDAISVGDNLKFENNKIELDFDILDGGDASDWDE